MGIILSLFLGPVRKCTVQLTIFHVALGEEDGGSSVLYLPALINFSILIF